MTSASPLARGCAPEGDANGARTVHHDDVYFAFSRGKCGGEVGAEEQLLQRLVSPKTADKIS